MDKTLHNTWRKFDVAHFCFCTEEWAYFTSYVQLYFLQRKQADRRTH